MSEYEKNVICKEMKHDFVIFVETRNRRGSAKREVARFPKDSGIGLAALGAAGRYIIGMVMADNVLYHGSPEGYRQLVGLGVIEEKEPEHAP